MTLEAVRGPRLPTVCPFVAFADERDLRAAVPDRRHRCYAVLEPEPRALAHQERYCLSPAFTSCPIFQDWATREAAQVAPGEDAVVAAAPLFDEEPDLPPSSPREAVAARPAWSSERDGVDDDEPLEDDVAAGAAAASAAALEREWDRPRRVRDYPPLGPRRAPRILTGIVILAIAALALFLLPTLLRAILGGPTAASPTPPAASGSGALPSGSASASASASSEPSSGASATPLVYIVQVGDNLTKIATKFNTTIPAILAANPKITNANNIAVGDQIIIPTLGAPVGSPSPSP
jgi:hypothetical protein